MYKNLSWFTASGLPEASWEPDHWGSLACCFGSWAKAGPGQGKLYQGQPDPAPAGCRSSADSGQLRWAAVGHSCFRPSLAVAAVGSAVVAVQADLVPVAAVLLRI